MLSLLVGYRVSARRGTRFRIWANGVLKDHLERGYTLTQRRLLKMALPGEASHEAPGLHLEDLT